MSGVLIDIEPGDLLGHGSAEAVFDPAREYRYSLTRRWDSRPVLAWLMLNPSTADAFADDPTIRRCVGFSQALGFGAATVVNLFALRSTDPKLLRTHQDPVGPLNNAHLAAALWQCPGLIVGWGAQKGIAGRVREVMQIVREAGVEAQCLGVNADGSPKHPLYLPGSARPQRWLGGDS